VSWLEEYEFEAQKLFCGQPVCACVYIRILTEERGNGRRRHERLIVSQKTGMMKAAFFLTMKVKI
jgi:hypothetical protein